MIDGQHAITEHSHEILTGKGQLNVSRYIKFGFNKGKNSGKLIIIWTQFKVKG